MSTRIADLTIASQLVFHNLHDNPWSTETEIRDHLGLSPNDLRDALAQLQEHGLVDRRS